MKCQRLNMGGFYAILTPHFQEQVAARLALLQGVKPMTTAHIRAVWDASPTRKTVGYAYGQTYVYARKVFNETRRRWELEFISCTPNRMFHTRELSHAVLIQPDI